MNSQSFGLFSASTIYDIVMSGVGVEDAKRLLSLNPIKLGKKQKRIVNEFNSPNTSQMS